MLEFIHYVHIVSGVVWAGGLLAGVLVYGPAMRALEPPALATFNAAVARYGGPVMGAAGGLVMLTGIARAIMGGGIRSVGDVFGPYGLWVLAALAIAVAVGAYGDISRGRLRRIAGEGGDPRPAMEASARRDVAVHVGGILAVLAIMVVLGMGLY